MITWPGAFYPIPMVSKQIMGANSEGFGLSLGYTNKTVKLFDLQKLGVPLHTYNLPNDDVVQIGWSPDNLKIASVSDEPSHFSGACYFLH
ncbi:hypothetical protein L1987_28012 [Smallanthus sonchifolius]|uniref:Uncharacterized protein n=1 Tax=Smallanthus sonchifolius TaxID=185202 RepID=A0ACB9IDI3_9ASTR|nr:hypothetical protein L1987_28012 [Smallanthus sonchifolius]